MNNLIAKYRALIALVVVALCAFSGCHGQTVKSGVAAAIAEAQAHPRAAVIVTEKPSQRFGMVRGKATAWRYDPKLDSVTFIDLTKFGATGDNPAGWKIDPTSGALVAPSGKVIAGVSFKQSPDAVSTTLISTKSGLAQTIDGQALNQAGMRVWQLTVGSSDGCWVTASGSWTRCDEAASGASLAGAFFAVGHGTSNKGLWIVTNVAGSDVAGTATLTATNLSTLGGGGGQSFPPPGDLAMANHGFTGERPGTTTGEPITYEQASQAVLQQSNGAFQFIRLLDTFQGAQAATTGAATVPIGVTFGTQGWRNSSTTGSLSIVTTAQDANHFGVVDLLTSGGASNSMGSQSVGSVTFGAGQTLTQRWMTQIPILSDVTNTHTERWGWVDSAIAPTNGLYIESVSGTSANYRCVAMNASTPTVATGGTPVAVAVPWTSSRITWDGTTAHCFIGSTDIGSITSGLPTVAVPRGFGILWVAGAARHFYVDTFEETQLWSTSNG